jgi:hypothetical protein
LRQFWSSRLLLGQRRDTVTTIITTNIQLRTIPKRGFWAILLRLRRTRAAKMGESFALQTRQL